MSPVLKIPRLRDVAVRRYGEWQCAQVGDKSLKMEYRQACGLTLADGLDLEQIFEDQDPRFYIDRSVKIGIARRFVSDVETWTQRQHGITLSALYCTLSIETPLRCKSIFT